MVDHLELAGLAEAPTTRHDHGGLVELRPGRLLDVHGGDLRRAGGARDRAPWRRPPRRPLRRRPSAANDFGRNAARNGPHPVNVVVTSVLPPNTGVVTLTVSPSTATSVLFVSTVRSSLTDRRP